MFVRALTAASIPSSIARCCPPSLEDHGIDYAFLGRELRRPPRGTPCYLGERVQYDRVANLPIFRQGSISSAGLRQMPRGAALAEKDPLTCHRTILVCRHLRNDNLSIQHILEDGTIETNEDAEEPAP